MLLPALLSGSPGPNGKYGTPGLPGLNGQKGQSGTSGLNGVDGTLGGKGDPGKNGIGGTAGPTVSDPPPIHTYMARGREEGEPYLHLLVQYLYDSFSFPPFRVLEEPLEVLDSLVPLYVFPPPLPPLWCLLPWL